MPSFYGVCSKFPRPSARLNFLSREGKVHTLGIMELTPREVKTVAETPQTQMVAQGGLFDPCLTVAIAVMKHHDRKQLLEETVCLAYISTL